MTQPNSLASDVSCGENGSQIDPALEGHQTSAALEDAFVSVPDDLLDVDSDLREEAPTEFPQTPHPRAGVVEETPTEPRPLGRVLFLVAVLTGVVIWLIGYAQRADLSTVLSRAVPIPPPSATLVDSRDGVVLILEQSGSLSRVIVEKSDEASWILVSRDDTTATNPALSPDGGQIAYVTERDGGQVVTVSIMTDTRRTIDADQIQDVGDSAGFDKMKLCPWTPIAWAPPMGTRIAFFGCTEDDSLSVALVGDLSGPVINLTAIARSKVESSTSRQLRWLDRTQIVITAPANGAQRAVVTTFVVP